MSNLQQQKQENSLIYCDLSVFTDEEREHHMQVVQDLFSKVSEMRESEDGYALRLPDEEGIIMKMADFINDDRKCCAFINFGMEIEAQGKGVWLTLKGNAEVKTAIQGEILGMIPDTIRLNTD